MGQSLSSSLSRSFRHGGLSSSYRSGRYTTAASAGKAPGAAAADALLRSPQSTEGGSNSVQAAARMLSLSSKAGSSDLDQLLSGNELGSSSLPVDGSTCENGHGSAPPKRAAAAGAVNGGYASTDSTSAGETGPEWTCRRSPHSQSEPGRPAGAAAAAGSNSSRCRAAAQTSGRPCCTRLPKPPASAPVRSFAGEPAASGPARRSGGADSLSLQSSGSVGAPAASNSPSLEASGSSDPSFLGTQLSMSPPLLSRQLSAPEVVAGAAAGSHGSSASSLQRPQAHQQQEQQQQQRRKEALQWQGHTIQALPHVLPAIPSEASFSVSASASSFSHASEASPPEPVSSWHLSQFQEAAATNKRATGSEVTPSTGWVGKEKTAKQQEQQQQRSNSRGTPFSAPGVAISAEEDAEPKPSLLLPGLQRGDLGAGSGTAGATAAADRANAALSSPPAAAAAPTASRHVRSVLNSPSLRAAATAAAARAEEEGLGLPNGLWLQQSQSLDSSMALSSALIPALSASSALPSPPVDAGSLTTVEFQLQQEADDQSEGGEGAVDALQRGSSSGSRAVEADTTVLAAAAVSDEAAREAAAPHPPSHSWHTRDPSVIDWIADTDEMYVGGRDASVMHWLQTPAAAAGAAEEGGIEQPQQGDDVFTGLAWLSAHTDSSRGEPAGKPASAAVRAAAAAAGSAGHAQPLSAGTAAGCSSGVVRHAVPVRPSAHRVAVPHCSRQHSSNSSRHCRRSWSSHLHRISNSRRSRAVCASSDGGGDHANSTAAAQAAVTSAAGGGAAAGSAEKAAVAAGDGDGEVVSGAAVATGHASSEGAALGASHHGQTSGDLAEFYVGSFAEDQGLDQAGQQLGLSSRMGSTEEPLDGDAVLLLTQAAEGVLDPADAVPLSGLPGTAVAAAAGEVAGQGSECVGDDGFVVGLVGLQGSSSLPGGGDVTEPEACLEQLLVAGNSVAGQLLRISHAANGSGAGGEGTVRAGKSAAAALASSGRSFLVDSSSTSAGALRADAGQLTAMTAAAAAAAIHDYAPKQQVYNSTRAAGRRAAGGPATIPMTGGAWYYALSSSGSSDRSSSDSEGSRAAVAEPYCGPLATAAATTAGGAEEGAAGEINAAPGFDIVRHAGGVAWLVRGLSAGHHLAGEQGDVAAAETQLGGLGVRGRGGQLLVQQQQQQPTFDDFDEPTAYYYAS